MSREPRTTAGQRLSTQVDAITCPVCRAKLGDAVASIVETEREAASLGAKAMLAGVTEAQAVADSLVREPLWVSVGWMLAAVVLGSLAVAAVWAVYT
jgi:hypothetical protein